MSIETLEDEYKTCTRCPELQEKTQVVFGSGNKNADILFIGEAPGANEDRQGIPFCGASGQVLNQLLESVGLSREDIFITNTILCRPPNNRNPKKEEMGNCADRLDSLIQIMQPKVIVTIGNFATQRVLGQTGITKIRGKSFPKLIAGKKRTIIPVIHPATFLYAGRNPEKFAAMQKDFEEIANICKGEKKTQTLFDF